MTDEIERPEDNKRVRSVVWRHLGVKSAREIAELAGVSPDVVLRVKRDLLDEVDDLTIQEKRLRIVVELDQMARETRERAQRVDDEFFSGAINSSVNALKAVLAELARMEKSDTSRVEALNALRTRELLMLINVAVRGSLQEIAENYGLDEDDLFSIFRKHLRPAAEELEARSQ